MTDRVDLHGYGYQAYMQTSGANSYNGADNQRSWDNNFLGLVATVTLTDKSKLWAQLQGSSNRGNDGVRARKSSFPPASAPRCTRRMRRRQTS